jgi:hypothetical protein
MSDLSRQVLASLQAEDVCAFSEDVLVALAQRLQPYLAEVVSAVQSDGWLDFDGALEYVGTKRGSLYKLNGGASEARERRFTPPQGRLT